MRRAIFRNSNDEAAFHRLGYTVVPFLDENLVAYFKDQFFKTIEQSEGAKSGEKVDYGNEKEITYDFTFTDENINYKQTVFNIITEKFQSIADNYLLEYKPIIANYIRKEENNGEVPMHQNWAFVDEMKYTSISIWVPLVDSNEDNGTLQMVNSSHKRFGRYRGPMIPWELRNLKKEIVAGHLTPMNVKAGTAVILDDSIIHYSDINKTSGLRLAIQLIMIPKEAEPIHYHFESTKSGSQISQLQANSNFYTHFHPWLKPEGLRVKRKIPYSESIYAYNDFLKGLASSRFDDVTIAPLFKEEQLNVAFEHDGFVKLPLLNKEEIEDLKNYYATINQEQPDKKGFHVSLDNTNEHYVESVFKKLFAVLEPKLKPYLKDFKCFTASYVVKEPGVNSWVPPHQDWSFVDETKYYSATVWIPLMEVNKQNGALGLIKGSHRVFDIIRNSPSPESKSALSEHLKTLFPYAELQDMLAGEALIFNNKTVHTSPPNLSSEARIGVGIGITQEEADLLHYYEVPNTNTLEVYQVEKDFFRKYSNSKLSQLYKQGLKPTDLKVLRNMDKPTVLYTKEELVEAVSSHPEVKKNMELEQLVQPAITVYNEVNTAQVDRDVRTAEKVEKQSEQADQEKRDARSFFEKYTIRNIIAEVKYRLSK
jgi:ectoine hydroxylase-related dioxygenase (phytanoyl-CoA dioxygenase family)